MIRQPRPALNHKGFSIIESLIGIGIFGAVIFAVIGFLQFSAKSQRRLQTMQAFNDQISLAQLSLDDVKSCTYNFGTVSSTTSSLDGITIPPVGGEIPVSLLKYDADQPTKARNLATSIFLNDSGQSLDNLINVLDVKLKIMAKVAPNKFIGHITIRADRMLASAGNAELSQAFPIYIATNATNKVLYCYGNYASGGLIDLQQKQCETLLGASYFWNPKINGCDTRFERKCYAGSRTTASCPSTGTFGLATPSCESTGVVDPSNGLIAGVNRTYASGKVVPAGLPSPVECQAVNDTTVNCDYAQDVNSSGAVCSACCNVEKPEAQLTAPINP